MPGESWRSGELARALGKRRVEVDRIGDVVNTEEFLGAGRSCPMSGWGPSGVAQFAPALDGLGAAGSHRQGTRARAAGVDVIPARVEASNWSGATRVRSRGGQAVQV